MSRLAGAVGALRGYQEGVLNDQQLKLKLIDTLQNLRQYEQTTLPESQARVGLTQELTATEQAKRPGVEAEAGSAQLEYKQAKDLYDFAVGENLPKKIVEEKASKLMAAKEKNIYQQRLEEERMKQEAYVPKVEAEKAEQERKAAEDIWKMRVLEAGPSPEEAAQLEWDMQKETLVSQQLGNLLRGKQVTAVDLANQLTTEYGFRGEEATIRARELQNDVIEQGLDEVENSIKAMREAGRLQEYYLSRLNKDAATIRRLNANGRHEEAQAKLSELMRDAAKNDPSLLFGARGRSLTSSDAAQSTIKEMLSLMKQASAITNTSVDEGAINKAISEVTGIIAANGKWVDENRGIDVDLTDTDDPISKETLKNINLKLERLFRGTGEWPQLELADIGKKKGLIRKRPKLSLTFRKQLLGGLSDKQIEQLPPDQQVEYYQARKIAQNRERLKPLQEGIRGYIETLLQLTLLQQAAELGGKTLLDEYMERFGLSAGAGGESDVDKALREAATPP